jgi:DNA-binding beta-propeller fold protein YncE
MTGKVNVFAWDGSLVRSFGEKGVQPGQINSPLGIGIDADDNVYIADRSTVSRIMIFDSKGKYLREFQVQPPDEEYMKQFNRKVDPLVGDVAIGKDGRIYLSDNSLHRLIILDEKGKFIKNVGGPGSDPGMFMAPGWLAINAKGEVHVCNGLNRRIEVFDLDGNFIRNYGSSKTFVGSFVGPTGITFDDKGNSIVADAAMSTIQFFSPAGEYLYHLADEKGEIDKDTKQRSVLLVSNTVGITFEPQKKLLFFGQGNEVKTVQARTLIE